MKAYYSIIKISPNSSAGDSLAIGLLLHSKKKFYLQFSENKKRAIKGLISENPEMIGFASNQIEQKIKELNSFLHQSENELLDIPHFIDSGYFKYLNSYSNGLLQFASPIIIDDDIDEEKFKKLFYILVDKEPIEKHKTEEVKEKEFFKRVENKLISRVKDKVHTNIRFDSAIIPDLYFSYDMNCIGLNGAFTGAKAISFYKTEHTIDTQISHYYILIDSLKKQFHKSSNNEFYIIADEPPVNTPLHKFWDAINKQTRFKVLCSEESDKVAEKIEESKAKMFIPVPTK